MLDTIKINTTKAKVIAPVTVQDIYGQYYRVRPNEWPYMQAKEKRFIQSGPYIENYGIYFPSLTFRKYNELFLEFSAPKIVFDNNVDELSNGDKTLFLNNLHERLLTIGLEISIEDLWNSNVSFATVSKNVVIDTIGAYEFIEFTRRLWWRWRHSLKLENYEHDGVCIREFSSTTGIGIYAKVPSLSEIVNPTKIELEFIGRLQDNNILRFEYRMQTYQRTLAKYSWAIGYHLNELRLKDIFSSELSQKILLYDLNKSMFSNEFKYISMKLPTIKRMYEYLWDKNLKPQEEFAVITAFRLCSDLGIEKTREIFDKRYSQSTTKRVWKLLDKAFTDFAYHDYAKIRDQISRSLNKFEPIKISNSIFNNYSRIDQLGLLV